MYNMRNIFLSSGYSNLLTVLLGVRVFNRDCYLMKVSPAVRWYCKSQDCHWGSEHTGKDQVAEKVQHAPSDHDLKCNVKSLIQLFLYGKAFMWYLVKCLLKVQVDEVHCFVVTCVVCVDDTGLSGSCACFWSHVESHLSGCFPQGVWLSIHWLTSPLWLSTD